MIARFGVGTVSLGLLIALVALGAACNFGREPGDSSMNFCETDSDCVEGKCYSNRCAVPPEEHYEIALQIIPSIHDSNRAPLSTLISPVRVEEAHQELPLQLPPIARVSGRVRFQGSPVPAVLSFIPTSKEHATIQRVEVETGDPLGDGSVDYLASLIPELEYAVELRPTSKPMDAKDAEGQEILGRPASRQLPPIRIGTARFDEGTNTFDYEFSGALLEPCTAERRSGCELRGLIRSEGRHGDPRLPSDIEIRALETATTRIVSSVDIVREGEFAIRIAEDAGEFRLQLSPAVGGSPYRATLIEGPFDADGIEDLFIYRYPVVDYEAIVFDSSGMEPIVGATVVFQSESVEDPLIGASSTSFFRASALTGEDGEGAGVFSLQLQPGTFQVTITPAASSDHGILITQVEIPDDETTRSIRGQAFILKKRPVLELTVDTFNGLPADNTDVQAIPLEAAGFIAQELARHARTSQGLTDWDGFLELPVDVARYELLMRPAPHTGFPHALTSSIDVTHPGFNQSIGITIPPPAIITGQLRDADGRSLGGATIRAYHLTSGGKNGGQLRRVGEAFTDDEGRYQLVLPSTPF